MRLLIFLSFLIICTESNSQNCEQLKSLGDTKQYDACVIGESAGFYYQFAKEYQQIYDSAIETCPYFASAYHAKSVAYLKSGNFIEWKRLIDKAVELDPQEYLGYRASCRFQFIHDYRGAIQDIDKLSSITDNDIGYTSDGDYHLDIVKAICYKQIGDNQAAINLFESKLKEEKYDPGLYDYYHFGIMNYQESQLEKAVNAFEKQNEINEFAEVYFHLALVYKELNEMNKYKENILLAQKLYEQGRMMTGDYTVYIDKIYLKDIKHEIENGS